MTRGPRPRWPSHPALWPVYVEFIVRWWWVDPALPHISWPFVLGWVTAVVAVLAARSSIRVYLRTRRPGR